jgi:hypothetical protein
VASDETSPIQRSTELYPRIVGGAQKAVLTLRRLRPAVVTCGWGATLSAFTLGGIFQGQMLPSQPPGNLFPEVINAGPWGPATFYSGVFAVSILAAILLNEAGTALLSFFASYLLGATITYFVLALPGFVGAFNLPEVLDRTAIVFTFGTSFPLPLLVELLGTLVGVSLSERF